MDEIEKIAINGETENGIHVMVRGTEEVEYAGGTFTDRQTISATFSRDEIEQLLRRGHNVLDRSELVVDGKTEVASVELADRTITLYIEPYEFPDDANLRKTWGIVTDTFELGAITSGKNQFEQDLNHSIRDVDGTAFRLIGEGLVDISFACRLTDWQLDDNGDVESIEVPDEPYEHGHFDLQPGDYRVWEEASQDSKE